LTIEVLDELRNVRDVRGGHGDVDEVRILIRIRYLFLRP